MLSALAAHADFLQVLPQLKDYNAGCLLKDGTSLYRRMQVGARQGLPQAGALRSSLLLDGHACQATCLPLRRPRTPSLLQGELISMLKRADVESIDSLQLPEGCFIDLDWCMGSPSFDDDIAAERLCKAHMLWLLQSNSTIATSEDTALALLLLYLSRAPGHLQQGVDTIHAGHAVSCIRWPYVSPVYAPICSQLTAARFPQLQVRVSRPAAVAGLARA
jgi:hypothetical protein